MRIIPFLVSFVLTIGLIIALSIPLPPIPPLGSFLSPQHGFWQNAEPTAAPGAGNFNFSQLRDKVEVYLDDRLVPHVFAQNDEDLYFVQGYLHAKYRLWQMEFQTMAAAGRLSEILGAGANNVYLNYDRNMRRIGMVYGAKRSLQAMEKDATTKKVMDAYTAGVNAYINTLPTSELPLEYRLLNYVPEHWSNLKTALFLKYMSYELSGGENDIENTNVRNIFSQQDFETLFPLQPDSLDPVIPRGSPAPAPLELPQIPVSSDSLYFLWTAGSSNALEEPGKNNGLNNWAVSGSKTKNGHPVSSDSSLNPLAGSGKDLKTQSGRPITKERSKVPAYSDLWTQSGGLDPLEKPDEDNGSNNWAVSGSKTKSGRPILCNDPHLGLSLPSLWFEMQLHTPTHNVYGVSFPGSPAIIIGFNDHCAWGVTNSSRDVKDYFNIRFKDASKKEYQFNGGWAKTRLEVDVYKVKGQADFSDTVAYTFFGPVQYDNSFTGSGRTSPYSNLAVRWKAHDPSNELKTFYLLNRMTGYQQYAAAIKDFTTPGQNFVFASKSNDIAIWHQGQFPAKWRRQGDFIMPGTDTAYLWQGYITPEENPHVLNPPRGFVSSANQLPTDTTYPYYLGGSYSLYRGMIINRYLTQMDSITVDSMKRMQTDNYNVFAEQALPILFANTNESRLTVDEKKYLQLLKSWNRRSDPQETGPAILQIWIDNLEKALWNDELEAANKPITIPEYSTLLKGLQTPDFKFADNVNTPAKETVQDLVTAAFKKSVPTINIADMQGELVWTRYKDGGVRHLLRLTPFSRYHLVTGGGANIINATKQFHGPSWRMIVELSDNTQAFGIYPGGQSGNPGSKYYDNFVDDWAAGKYAPLWVMKENDAKDKRILFTMSFSN